tara:strand:+ start:310 stop:438 length:129 start_codon:yes stop_codon:yes gene_type:complete
MRPKLDVSKEELIKMYIGDKLSTFKIADEIGCCQATVWKRLK